MKLDVKRKAFGEKVVFEDRIFRVYGRRTLIKGPSGSGKTTLLRMLSLLDDDYEGTYSGKPRSPLVLFQEDRLSMKISVLSNLMMVTSERDRALDVLSKVGLAGEEMRKCHELSGGMRRRLAIARILLLPSDVLFLDEPLRGLDEGMKESVSRLILDTFPSSRIVVVSHEEEDQELFDIDSIISI